MKFRFQDLQILQFAIEISDELLIIADDLENKSCLDLPNSLEVRQ